MMIAVPAFDDQKPESAAIGPPAAVGGKVTHGPGRATGSIVDLVYWQEAGPRRGRREG